MPYLHCPRCHRRAWLRARPEQAIACRRCGTTLDPVTVDDVRLLAGAVRERFARDARLDARRARFIRDPQRAQE
jgi:transcription initiation factor IIE alpha subunit